MRRPREEGGAVAVFLAVAVVLVLGAGALAVDLGMQRVVRRDMQALADVVSLDLARQVNGRTVNSVVAGTPSEGLAPWQEALDASVARNADSVLGERPATCPVPAGLGQAVSSVSDVCVRAFLVQADTTDGSYPTSSDGVPTALASGQVPNAVVVMAGSVVDFSFARVLGVGSGSAERSALAMTDRSACYRIGSYVAALNGSGSSLLAPLNNLLGLDLTLAGYQGLASASVSVVDLVATGDVGTLSQLMDGGVRLGSLLDATAEVLTNQQQALQANAAATPQVGADADGQVTVGELQVALNAITSIRQRIQATYSSRLDAQIQLGDVLSLSNDDDSALSAGFNVLDLLGGAVSLADGTNAAAISVPTTYGTVNLSIVEGPKQACGRVGDASAQVTTSQVSASGASLSLTSALGTLPSALTSLTQFQVSDATTLNLSLGNATARLASPEPVCLAGTTASPDTLNVAVQNALSTLTLSSSTLISGKLTTNIAKTAVSGLPSVPGLGGLSSVVTSLLTELATTVPVDLIVSSQMSATSSGTGSSTSSVSLGYPTNVITPAGSGTDPRLPTTTPTITSTTSVGVDLDRDGTSDFDLAVLPGSNAFGVAANTALGPVRTALTTTADTNLPSAYSSVVSAINTNVLAPYTELLGVDLAGADVWAGTTRPDCATPRLSG